VNRDATQADSHATMTAQVIGSELHAGDVLGGRFRIEALIGIGGMGVVYRARDLSLDIEVALKLLRPELARKPDAFESFRRELLLARQVSSPHVVRIHDIAADGGRWFISMDYIDGESLEHRLDRGNGLPVAQALAITHGLLDGLAAAHQRGVVHRDLKPANVLINAEGHAYISDFGIARSLGATGLTQTGMIVGTPEYLSPEQARGQSVDGRSDLYAVGLILFEMLVGQLPFSGGTPAETVMQRILRPPPSLAKARPDLPRWLHAFNDRLLKVNPAHRFESAKSAIRAFEARRVPRPPLDRRLIAGAALALIAIGAVALPFWRNPSLLQHLIAPVAAATPRVALLPLSTPADDAELAPLARALEEHLHAWLRGDPAISAVPRRRVLDALARVAPGAQDDALTRQLPEIAQAANATRLLRGSLTRAADGSFQLTLSEPARTENAGSPLLQVSGANPAALYAAYLKSAATLFSNERWRVGAAPDMPGDALLAVGRALLALDQGQANAAASELATSLPAAGTSALIEKLRLDAEEADHQQLPTQNTRDAIVKQFAGGFDPLSRELYARALAGDGDAEKAQQTLTAATQAFPHDTALALLDVDTLAANGESEKALDLLKTIVKSDDQDARVWFLLGRTAIQQGQPRAAVDDYLVRALVLNTRAGNANAEAETRNALGIGYDRLGQPEAAIEQYQRAAAMREKLGDTFGLTKTLRNLAVVQSVSGQRDAAEKTLERAKTLLEGIGDRASLADLQNDRGVIAEENGDFATATSAYREALAIRQQLDVPNLVAESLNNVGFASFQLGKFDDALVYWQQALAVYEKLDDRGRMLKVQQSMGSLDIARGHFADAAARLRKTTRSAEDAQLSEQAAIGHSYLADLALTEGHYQDAVSESTRALDIATRRSDHRVEAEARLQLARSALASGSLADVDRSLAAIDAGELGDEQRAAFLLLGARRARLAGDAKLAQTKLDESAQAAAQAHSGALDMQIRLERVRSALASGDRAAATLLLKALAAETNRLNEVPLRLQWLELEMAAALDADPARAVAYYRQALALLKDVGDYADATTIHDLGARALPVGAEADAARHAAATARERVLANAPEPARAALAANIDRRLREEAPENAH
jgi:tetratricopeptide (TPR) repeat protein